MNILFWLAIIPSIIIALLIYKADPLDKEPKKELFKAFDLGILAIISTLVLSTLFNIGDIDVVNRDIFNIFIYSFIGISLIEEFSKWICSYLFLKNNKNFNYLFDGIVYTTFVALGFATIENILYTFSGGVVTGIIRAITTVPAHAFFGISSGYFLSLLKKEKLNNNYSLSNKYLFLSLLVPFLLHGFYDFCLLTQNYILFIIYIIFMVWLYNFSINNVKKMKKLDFSFDSNKKIYCKYCGDILHNDFCSRCDKKN